MRRGFWHAFLLPPGLWLLASFYFHSQLISALIVLMLFSGFQLFVRGQSYVAVRLILEAAALVFEELRVLDCDRELSTKDAKGALFNRAVDSPRPPRTEQLGDGGVDARRQDLRLEDGRRQRCALQLLDDIEERTGSVPEEHLVDGGFVFDAIDAHDFAQQVTGGTGDITYDSPLLPYKRIQQG